jgi:16S rRNA (guanine1516-N2)-methyltransferase
LRPPAALAPWTVTVDPLSGPLQRRLRTAGRRQPLARAIGLHRRAAAPAVFDATAGLGRDALQLAHLGCKVLACERVPVLAVMLEDAAARAGLAERVTVVCGEATAVLATLAPGDRPEVIYLDPMYEHPSKAQVQKEMQVCRWLCASPDDAPQLLRRALAAAAGRVVLKRHPDAPVCERAPSFTVAGQRVRFDVYLTGPA